MQDAGWGNDCQMLFALLPAGLGAAWDWFKKRPSLAGASASADWRTLGLQHGTGPQLACPQSPEGAQGGLGAGSPSPTHPEQTYYYADLRRNQSRTRANLIH